MKKLSIILSLLLVVSLVIVAFGCVAEEPEEVGPEGPPEVVPEGLYKSSSREELSAGAYVDFKSGNVLEWYRPLWGKTMFEYELLDGGTRIKLTSLTGQIPWSMDSSVTTDFKYVKAMGFVSIGRMEYWKD